MRVEVFADDEWAGAVARRWIDRLGTKPDLVMCLPTGNTPRPVYAAMAAAVEVGEVSFAGATIFILDEFGGLDVGDPGRCDTMLQRDLLDKIDLPPTGLMKLDPDAMDVDADAAAYRRLVNEAGLDLTIVGIGGNGHVGLNEPGTGPNSTTRRVVLSPATIAAHHSYNTAGPTVEWGVTLGIDELMRSTEIWLIANGRHKSTILRDALEGPIGPGVPASLLRNHSRSAALLDAGAASLLDLDA